MPRILVIDDDFQLRRLYEGKLKLEGFEVETALDGLKGLEKAESFQPHLILLDILMPGMDGFQVMEELKNDPQTKKIPVVFLTNLSRDEGDIKKGLELGAIAYLVKAHYTPSQVVAKIREFLKAYSPKEEAPSPTPEQG